MTLHNSSGLCSKPARSYIGNTAWMVATDRPAVRALAAGFTLVDRTQRPDAAHPMRRRNGEGIARRLERCSLYDRALDLAVEDAEGYRSGHG
ncbi:hypothetical protein [Occultella kanbiaonis]|uniref:hypothetical protein n=1 Tax=Occultella kanbiaonis TaxID=2675754 RepID=UPI0013D588D0|nr:hypothetical protein [Occultella kanbiaonis]